MDYKEHSRDFSSFAVQWDESCQRAILPRAIGKNTVSSKIDINGLHQFANEQGIVKEN